ncbi:hypothetical protein ACH3XW_18055 [Acanthocheilonema viteae]
MGRYGLGKKCRACTHLTNEEYSPLSVCTTSASRGHLLSYQSPIITPHLIRHSGHWLQRSAMITILKRSSFQLSTDYCSLTSSR